MTTHNKLQKIHDMRTKRALRNLEKIFKMRANYGFIKTKGEIDTIKDLHPGIDIK